MTPDSEAEQTRTSDRTSLSRKAAGGAGLVFLAMLAGKSLGLGFRITATNLLGPASFGVYAFGLSIVGILSIFGTGGLDRAVLRFASASHGRGNPEKVAAFTRLGALCATVLLGTVATCLLFTAPWIASAASMPGLTPVLRLLALGLPFMGLLKIASVGFQAVQKMRPYTITSSVLGPALALLWLAPIWWILQGAGSIALARSLGWVVASCMTLWLLARQLPLSTSVRADLGRLFRFSAKMILFAGAAYLTWHIDRLMLGFLATSEEVGIYDVAANLASHIPLVLGAFNAIFFPMAGSLFHGDRLVDLRSLYRTVTRWVVTLTLPAFFFLVFAPNFFLSLFGKGFTRGHDVLLILAVANLAAASVGAVGGLLMMTDRENLLLLNTVILGTANGIGNAVLIPILGIHGAAISTALSIALWNVAGLLQVYRAHGLQPYDRHYLRPIFAFVGMSMVAVTVSHFLPSTPVGILPSCGAGLVTYGSILLYQGLLPEDEPVWNAVMEKLNWSSKNSAEGDEDKGSAPEKDG